MYDKKPHLAPSPATVHRPLFSPPLGLSSDSSLSALLTLILPTPSLKVTTRLPYLKLNRQLVITPYTGIPFHKSVGILPTSLLLYPGNPYKISPDLTQPYSNQGAFNI